MYFGGLGGYRRISLIDKPGVLGGGGVGYKRPLNLTGNISMAPSVHYNPRFFKLIFTQHNFISK
jgi:hypothetical protein